jgi:hypothetical protein
MTRSYVSAQADHVDDRGTIGSCGPPLVTFCCSTSISQLGLGRHAPTADLGDSPVSVTDIGSRLRGQIGTAVTEITQRLWGDLPSDDVAIAGRVRSGAILEGERMNQ